MLKKHNIFSKSHSFDIFKSVLDMDLMLFGDRNTSHGLTLELLPYPQPSQRQPPLTYSQQLSFLAFLELFLPTAWTRPKISQHLLTKMLKSLTHTLK